MMRKFGEQQVTLPGHGASTFRMFDKGKNSSMLTVKMQSKDLALNFDSDEEADLVAQLKLARATDEFFLACVARCKIQFRDGELKAVFDWTGIKRQKLEAEAQAEKRAALKQRMDEERQEREAVRVQRLAAAKLAQEEEEVRQAREKQEAEDRARREEKQEAERAEREKWERFEAMGAKFTAAMLNPGAAFVSSSSTTAAAEVVERVFDEFKGCFYYIDSVSNTVTWRDPRTAQNSPWEKTWVEDEKQFHYTHEHTGQVLLEEPYATEIEKIWVADNQCFYYVDRVTGETSTEEPYY